MFIYIQEFIKNKSFIFLSEISLKKGAKIPLVLEKFLNSLIHMWIN